MPVRAEFVSTPAQPVPDSSDEILRFRRSERHLHWALAIPFVVCYATALVLVFVYNPHPTRPYRWLFSWIHRISGVCLAVLPSLMILLHWRDLKLHLSNIRRAWTWSFDDVKWLLLVGPATLNKRIKQPDQGKFNAGEKINFMAQTATYPIYVVTGLLIWLPGIAYLSWMVHVSMALTATPLILGHIFMATVNPDTRVGLSGMTRGLVDRQWARHHYRYWYDELYGEPEPAEETASRAEVRSDNVVPFRPHAPWATPAFLRRVDPDAGSHVHNVSRRPGVALSFDAADSRQPELVAPEMAAGLLSRDNAATPMADGLGRADFVPSDEPREPRQGPDQRYAE